MKTRHEIICKMEELEEKGFPYDLEISGSKIVLTSDLFGAFERGTKINPAELWVLGAVRKEFRTHEVPKIKSSDVLFRSKKANLEDGEEMECMEFDLTRAYWSIAVKLGYVSEALNKKVIERKVSNDTLRVALGALAKYTEYYIYDGIDECLLDKERSKRLETAGFFWRIAKECGDLMRGMAFLEGFVAFYTDAVIFKRENADLYADYLKKAGYLYKNEGVFRVVYDAEGELLEIRDAGRDANKSIKRLSNGSNQPYLRIWRYKKAVDKRFWA